MRHLIHGVVFYNTQARRPCMAAVRHAPAGEAIVCLIEGSLLLVEHRYLREVGLALDLLEGLLGMINGLAHCLILRHPSYSSTGLSCA